MSLANNLLYNTHLTTEPNVCNVVGWNVQVPATESILNIAVHLSTGLLTTRASEFNADTYLNLPYDSKFYSCHKTRL